MSEFVCPLCGQKEKCEQLQNTEEDYIGFHCEHYSCDFSLADDIVLMENSDQLKESLLDLVTEHLIHSKYCDVQGIKYKWHFFYAQNYTVSEQDPAHLVNLAELHKSYPNRFMDKAHRALMNLSIRLPNYGDVICLFYTDKRLIFEHSINNTHTAGMLDMLVDLGYLSCPKDDQCYMITADGWKKIDEIRKSDNEIRQGFIAMSFRDETRSIREAFRQAISDSEYQVRIIDEKEHNNQIVPELFYEISRSKFVVVDVTYPNYGAYYEAGYAQSLGKQVIVCCRADEFDNPAGKPHFDISQKSMIVWKDEDDLVSRLKRRIEATVR